MNYFPGGTQRFYKRLLALGLVYNIFMHCHSLKFVYSEIMGRVTLCLEQHLMDMFPEPSPSSLRKESLNLGCVVQLWVVAWLIVLPLICDPFLGAGKPIALSNNFNLREL